MIRLQNWLWPFITSVTLLLGTPDFVQACGLTPPIGPNGLPSVCHGNESGWRFRAGLTLGGTDTRIEIDGRKAELVQAASVATLDILPTERLNLSLSGGASIGGQVDYEGQRYDLAPGPIGGVGASYLLFGKGLPFIHMSLTLSLSQATVTAPSGIESSFTSRDWRLGAAIGKDLGSVAAPFVVARYFGGGTDWSGIGKGADDYRYHVGIGSAIGLFEHIDVLVELALLGERRATLGAGYLF
ncbi:MAG TPA: hypothetical protein VJ385_18685 [Fibrobacteria bacterium]|nr:hypothetical protein [Fibrobacteria bacterium]